MSPAPLQQAPAWRVVRLERSLGEHAAAWDALNDARFSGHPLLGSRFVEAMLEHFGDGTEHLCMMELHGEVQAMGVVKPRTRWLWTTFLPSQAPMGPLLMKASLPLGGLIQSLPGPVLALDLMRVDPRYADESIGSYPAIELHHASTMSVRLQGSFADYWESRSAHLRQNIRRYRARKVADGLPVRHVILTEADDIPAAVQRYAELEATGWKGTAGTALGIDNAQGRFYRDLLTSLARRGQAEVHELWLGSRLAASRLIALQGRCLVMLKTTFDERLSVYAPGRLLLTRVLESAFERHAGATVEFYTDATHDQLAWATESRSMRHVQHYRGRVAEALVKCARVMRERAARRLPVPPPGTLVEVSTCDHPDRLPRTAIELFEHAVENSGAQGALDWYRMLIEEVFNDGSEACFFVLCHDGRAVAVLPMVRTVNDPTRPQALRNYYTSHYLPPIAPWLKAADLVPLIHAIRRHWPGSRSFSFDPMDPQRSEFHRLRSALGASGLVPFRFFRFGNWTLECRGLRWKEYLGQRKGSVRSTISRMTKKLDAAGGRLELITGADRLEAGIQAYEQVYATSWKQAEPFPGFVRRLMVDSAAKGQLRLGVAWLGETPIAAQIWIVAGGRADIFKIAYDEAYKAYSVGTLLTALLMSAALETDQVYEVDYLTGDDPYKKTWMSRRKERWGIVAYDPRNLRGALGLLREGVGWVRRAWRRTSDTLGNPPPPDRKDS